MSATTEPFNVPLTGGLSHAINPMRADKSSFYNLHGFRQSTTTIGNIEQVPWFSLARQLTVKNYWNGASVAEPSGSGVRGILPGSIALTDYTATKYSAPETQVQVIYQSVFPAAETIYTGCLLVINNNTALALTLGQTLDVEMTGAAAFRWRKNGGGWTAGVPSTAGVSIDTGNATLYFLANTGFAGTEAWSWQRTDYMTDPTFTGSRASQMSMVDTGTNIYFNGNNDRIMRMSKTDQTFIISAGYRPIYGSFLTVFYNHLVVAAFSRTPSVIYNNNGRGRTIGWSDVDDLDNFIPTDVNEADEKTWPLRNTTTTATVNFSVAVGLYVQQSVLYVFFGTDFAYTSYEGLPNVFSFQPGSDFQIGITSPSAVVSATDCAYIFTNKYVYRFSNGSFTIVSQDVTDLYSHGVSCFGYCPTDRQLIIASNGILLTYQETINKWYTRGGYFDGDNGTTAIMGGIAGGWTIGAYHRKVLYEDTSFTAQPAYDQNAGTEYSTPKITTQLIGETIGVVKEITDSTVNGYQISTTDSTYYSTGADARVTLNWYKSTDGRITGTPTTDTNAYWDPTKTGRLSYPRDSFYLLAMELQGVGQASGKPVGGLVITGLELYLYNAGSSVEQ